MRRRRGFTYLGAFVAIGFLGLLRPARAETPSSPQACIDAHANGQVARGQGNLLQAKEYFLSCATERCPQMIRDDCAKFGSEVESVLPSVVVVAETASHNDLGSAAVRVDEAAETLPVDGRALFINPGRHSFRVTTPDGSEATVTTVIREAEKYRRVVAQLVPRPEIETKTNPKAEATRGGGRKVPALAYVFGGVGLLAAGSFAYFALDGRHKETALDKCAPHCERADVDAMRRSYLVGDVSLGIAAASLGLGAYLFFSSPSSDQGSNVSAMSLSLSPDLSVLRLQAVSAF